MKTQLIELRNAMQEADVNTLIVTSDDYHQSEYVGEFFKARAYISGFTGSAGTLVVTHDDARLFTDGRYFIQAEQQLKDSGITLMKSGTPGVPSPLEFAANATKSGETLAIDGRCVSAASAAALRRHLPDGASLRSDLDLPGAIWTNRPPLPCGEIWRYDEKFHGKSHLDKLSDVREVMGEKNCTALVMSSLCDIAWLYNLRGSDVAHTPVFLAFTIVTPDSAQLFVNNRPEFTIDGVEFRDYAEFYPVLAAMQGETVMVDKSACSEMMIASLSGCKIVDAENPTVIMKAVKSQTELDNSRKCHLADGLAVTKLMLTLKYDDRAFNEVTVADHLLALRRECADRLGVHFMDESFDPICGFGANGAVVHYKAEPDSAAKIDKTAPVPMLLVDSGGQYLEGTTDITRTFVLGEIPQNVRRDFTLVVMGMLRLADAVFPEGTSGKNLDILCRAPLFAHGLDYRHGTGHGVGHLLSVHEGPQRFHMKSADTPIRPGMITSDEPGYYEEGSHGIRIENELCACKKCETEYGKFLAFETLTLCPIDLDGIDPTLMDSGDIRLLNAYHRRVYDALSPHLCAGDREKLAYMTREISS